MAMASAMAAAVWQAIKSSFAWVLSGTPPLDSFDDVKSIARFIGVHLGSSSQARALPHLTVCLRAWQQNASNPWRQEAKGRRSRRRDWAQKWERMQAVLSKKGKFVDKEMTCLEQLQSFMETRSTAWHLRR